MNDQLENRLRSHLSSVEAASVADVDTVSAAATRHTNRLNRRRRVGVGAGCAALAAIAATALVARDVGDTTQPGSGAEPATPPSTTTASSTTVTLESAWSPIAPDPRGHASSPSVVWTGTEALVVGGTSPSGSGTVRGAASFHVGTGTWERLPDPSGPADRRSPVAFWTGEEMWVIGGETAAGESIFFAEAYRPGDTAWRAESGSRLGERLTDRSPWTWTGDTLLVLPESSHDGTFSAYAFSPTSRTWMVLAPPPIEERRDAASVWTGTEWIVWGGTNGERDFADGAAYSPATGSWRILADSPLSPRRVRAVWTGTEMLAVAGSSGGDPVSGDGSFAHDDGAAYDPERDTWRSLAAGPAHPGFVPLWTGTHVLAFAKGGVHVYDAGADRWEGGCCDGEPHAVGGTPVWTGSVALLIGSDTPLTGGETFAPMR
jgi:hypothetical protein